MADWRNLARQVWEQIIGWLLQGIWASLIAAAMALAVTLWAVASGLPEQWMYRGQGALVTALFIFLLSVCIALRRHRISAKHSSGKSQEMAFLAGYDPQSRGLWDLLKDGQALSLKFVGNVHSMNREQQTFAKRIGRRTRTFTLFKNRGRINAAHNVLVKASQDIESHAVFIDDLHLDKYAGALADCYATVINRASALGGDNRRAADELRRVLRDQITMAGQASDSVRTFRTTVDELVSGNLSSDLNQACRRLTASLDGVLSAIASYRRLAES